MKYPCTNVNGICWEGTWALVSTFVVSIFFLASIDDTQKLAAEFLNKNCSFLNICPEPNRRAFKEETLLCSVSDI